MYFNRSSSFRRVRTNIRICQVGKKPSDNPEFWCCWCPPVLFLPPLAPPLSSPSCSPLAPLAWYHSGEGSIGPRRPCSKKRKKVAQHHRHTSGNWVVDRESPRPDLDFPGRPAFTPPDLSGRTRTSLRVTGGSPIRSRENGRKKVKWVARYERKIWNHPCAVLRGSRDKERPILSVDAERKRPLLFTSVPSLSISLCVSLSIYL